LLCEALEGTGRIGTLPGLAAQFQAAAEMRPRLLGVVAAQGDAAEAAEREDPQPLVLRGQ
jgi:2-hydroxychromene-2-carboxylate isomerase